MNSTSRTTGKVYIVGAGPGAVDLITLKGLRVLRQADVVLFDALVDPELLLEAEDQAEKIFVGKRCGAHAMEQPEINRQIVAKAREGKTVVRLKGGDPLVFGRGGEEALACEEAGIEFELIPGISSALGAASYAGIPLTHRGVSSSVAFITAREGRQGVKSDESLARLAESVDTLVIFMGGSRLQSIADALMEAGIPEKTSVAVISQATSDTQQTIVAPLDSVSERVAGAQLATPMLIIIGEVTNLSASLNWFERRHLAGVATESPALDETIHLQWPE